MNKKIIITTILTITLIMLTLTNVQAAFHMVSPSTTEKSDTPTNWIINIRKMEEAEQGMGFNELVDSETGLATTDTNNIDVHMLKNTEYGAIVILGASDYGKTGNGIDKYMTNGDNITTGTTVKASSTGNSSGVYDFIGNYEWVAAGGNAFLPNIAPRYINRYTLDESSAKVGDATVETKGWHGSGYSSWGTSEADGFTRAASTAFSYSSSGWGEISSTSARAAVTVWPGI